MHNCNPALRGARNHSHEALLNSGFTSVDSGLQLELADRAKRRLSEYQVPAFSARPDVSRNCRMTKSSTLLRARRQFVHLYFTRSTPPGVLPARTTDSRSTKAVKTFVGAPNKTLSVVAMRVNNPDHTTPDAVIRVVSPTPKRPIFHEDTLLPAVLCECRRVRVYLPSIHRKVPTAEAQESDAALDSP